jgi:multiple sugar transport system ATP-binding protein
VILGIRPSDFEDASLADASWPTMAAPVQVVEALGSENHVLFTVNAPAVRHDSLAEAASADGQDAADEALPLTGGTTLWTARVAARSKIGHGDQVDLAVDCSNLQFFDPATGLAIGHPQALAA